MKKKQFVSVFIIIMVALCGCGNNKDKVQEEITTQTEDDTEDEYDSYEVIFEKPDKVVLATLSDSEKKEGSPTDADGELPDVMEPLDNDYRCNPRITNLSLMSPDDFDRDRLLDAMLTYMYYEGISDDVLEEIHVDESDSQGTTGYKMTLKFKRAEDREVTVFWYNHSYYDVQTYIDDSDIGFDIND